MTFDEILAQVTELLQHEGRVAYRVLKRRFGIDDEYVEDLKADLIDAKRLALDEDGKVLVWTGAVPVLSSEPRVPSPTQSPTPNPPPLSGVGFWKGADRVVRGQSMARRLANGILGYCHTYQEAGGRNVLPTGSVSMDGSGHYPHAAPK